MKIQDKAMFDQQNVFGQGQANTAFAQFLSAILISIP